jgi:hypothetical protein
MKRTSSGSANGATRRFIHIFREDSEMAKPTKSHPGFKAVQKKIEKEGYSKGAAGAILANASRKASPKAKKANPKLSNVKGKY